MIEFNVFFAETEDIVQGLMEHEVFTRSPLNGHSIETTSLALMHLMHENADSPEFMNMWVRPRIGWIMLVRKHANDLRRIVNDITENYPTPNYAHKLRYGGTYYIIESGADQNQIIMDILQAINTAQQERSVSIFTGGVVTHPDLWRIPHKFIKTSLREIMVEVFTTVISVF